MPSDDVILNLKQIAGYPPSDVLSSDTVVVQRGGLGGPYMSIPANEFVSAALADRSMPMQVGVVAPANADGAQTFSNAIVGSFGQHFWNAYIASGQAVYLQSGLPAAMNQCDPNLGWCWEWAPPGGAGQPVNLTTAFVISPTGYVTVADTVLLGRDPVNQMEAATGNYVNLKTMAAVQPLWALYYNSTVWSFNNRTGTVILGIDDVMGAGGASICSPAFTGQPTAPTPPPASNDNSIATTQFVWQAIGAGSVASFNGRTGAVVLTPADVSAAGGLANPNVALTGVPTAPTRIASDNSTAIATTAFVQNALGGVDFNDFAPLNSPAFTGQPTAPTVPPGASDGRIATTAFVHAAVVAATTGVSSFNTRTGAVTLTGADVTGAGGALLAGPVFTGVPSAPTAAPGTSTTQLATTAFVMAALSGGGTVVSFNGRTGAVTLTTADITGAGGAPTVSPALTGVPTAPTASGGTSTTQIATTAFVQSAISGLGGIVSSFNGRSGAVTLQANDISAAGGAVLASPAFSGVPTAPTATAGTNTSQIATTSFVAAAIAAGGGVASVNGRTGAVTIIGADITGAGGALLASPTFTGVPSGPTATVGTSNTQLATTAFVQAAFAAGAVTSFNSRTGAVTLTTADITGAGGAVLSSPAFTGAPTAPTAAAATNTTQIATTAFVQQAINAIGAGVVSFNGRTGAVSLIANDISAAGGAVLASPAFTGSPTAPTAAPGTSTTQLATTAFVSAAITAGAYLPLAGGALTGPVTSNNNFTTTGGFIGGGFATNVAPGVGAVYGGQKNGLYRWQICLGNGTAESGSNAGSDFNLIAVADNGSTALGYPLSIFRATGCVNINGYGATAVTPANAGGVGSSYLTLNKTPATQNVIEAFANGNARWAIIPGNANPESGSNSGSDFNIAAYADNGAFLGSYLSITRANCTTVLSGAFQSNGPLRTLQNGTCYHAFCDGAGNIGTQIYHVMATGQFYVSNHAAGDLGMFIDSSGHINASVSPAYLPGGGPWTASSDARIKTVEREYRSGLADILKLRPVVYRYKGNDTPTKDFVEETPGDPRPARHRGGAPYPASPHYHTAREGKPLIGLVAQEVQGAFPEMVDKKAAFIDGEPVDDLLTLNTGPLVFALVNAVKTLAMRIEALEARLAA